MGGSAVKGKPNTVEECEKLGWEELIDYRQRLEWSQKHIFHALVVALGTDPLQMFIAFQVSTFLDDGAIHTGFMKKRGDHMNTWRNRFFALYNDCIKYYEHDETITVRGELPLKTIDTVKIFDEDDRFIFGIVTPQRTWLFQVEDKKNFNLWLKMIADTLQNTGKYKQHEDIS